MLNRFDFPGGLDSTALRPVIPPEVRPHYDALSQGRLMLPVCADCERVRAPTLPLCSWCFSPSTRWREASGTGRVHSVTRYHRAFLPEFASLTPYVVLAVQLDEGPIVFGRLLASTDSPSIGTPVSAALECWADGFCALAFVSRGGEP